MRSQELRHRLLTDVWIPNTAIYDNKTIATTLTQ